MDRLKTLEAEWSRCFRKLEAGEFMRCLLSGTLDPAYYRAYMRETYHNASQNVKNMALFQAHARGGKGKLEAKLLKHAAMEVGHDAMALDDYAALGGDAAEARAGRPLPATEAMAAFIVFQIQHRNPYAYLGYLYHLEALPVAIGEKALAGLDKIGVPRSATTFLREHADADPVHVKWNREYVEGFPETDEDFAAVLYGMRGTCELHTAMFQAVIDSVRSNRAPEALAA